MDSCGPAATTDVALTVRKHPIAVTRTYCSVERVVDRDLNSGVLSARQLDVDGDDVVAAVTAAAVHSGSFGRAANHHIFDVAAGLILDHLLQLPIHLRRARSGNGDVAALGDRWVRQKAKKRNKQESGQVSKVQLLLVPSSNFLQASIVFTLS